MAYDDVPATYKIVLPSAEPGAATKTGDGFTVALERRGGARQSDSSSRDDDSGSNDSNSSKRFFRGRKAKAWLKDRLDAAQAWRINHSGDIFQRPVA